MAIFSHLIPAKSRHDMRDTSGRFDDNGRDHGGHRGHDHDHDHGHDHGHGGHRDHRW
ncbi:hypothetical protein [Streptomyces atratus]|uniref:hypothetical protein n=1 Tax=Streptomyces atratus TaxID=1893 RepID=UPI002251D734|nr:hypothetical protein [Streptomyces atratus]MCX5343596.1 hypothetical protein [Streptomyces atratus]